jgi:acetyl esterase/lipase
MMTAGLHQKAASSNATQSKSLSLVARVMRIGLRLVAKPALRANPSVDGARWQLTLVDRLVPRPPRGTETIAIDAGGVPADRVTTAASRHDRHIIYLHGGGYVAGWAGLCRDLTWRLATLCRVCVLSIDYRLAPEHPFPAALDDAVAAYRWLLAQGADPKRIALMGDSAGGGLVLAAVLRLRDEGVELPAAAVVVSPWTDLALTGPSLHLNAIIDPLIPVELAPRLVDLCLAGANPRNPYASPLYGDPTGLPPTLILVGADEVLRDDAVRMADKMRAAGCHVEIEIWPHMWHVWYMCMRVMPEAKAAIARIATFVSDKL